MHLVFAVVSLFRSSTSLAPAVGFSARTPAHRPLLMASSTPQITASFGTPIRQFAGQVQVTRRVKVKVPGKHFSGLSAAEQKLDYWVT